MSCSVIARSSSGGISERVEADTEMTSLRRITCCCPAPSRRVRLLGASDSSRPTSVWPAASLDHVRLIAGTDFVVGDEHVQQDGICRLIADAAQIRADVPARSVDGVARRAVSGEHLTPAGGVAGPFRHRRPHPLVHLHAIAGLDGGEECRARASGWSRRDDSSAGCAASGPERRGRDRALFDRVEQHGHQLVLGHERRQYRFTQLRRISLPAARAPARRDVAVRSGSCTVALTAATCRFAGCCGESSRASVSPAVASSVWPSSPMAASR